jgi:gliding-associated putative ABC transporter substrate-binding component GldG
MQNPKKWEDLLQFVAVALAVVIVNLLAVRYFFRLDLTQDQRYTAAPATRQVLAQLDEVVYIECFLDGDLNAGFKRLQKSLRETLDDFAAYGGGQVKYKFINPDQATSEAERNKFYRQLVNRGIQPTNLYDNVNGKRVQKIIFPGVIVSYRNREAPVLLLKGNKATSAQEQLNQSVEGIEYELITAIKKLTQPEKPRVALIQGHNELTGPALADFTAALDEFYLTEPVNLAQQDLTGFAAALVVQPKTRWAETEKFKLDQYIMRGGKAMFLLDMVQMNIDSIGQGGAYAFGYDLDLNDMLFKYGVRPNLNLVQDQQMSQIVVNVGQLGNQPNLQPIPWPYFVLANHFGNHPTTRNLNAIATRFVSTIDTIKGVPGVKKTAMLLSNQYSRVRRAPTMVNLDELKIELDNKLYTQKLLPLAYLLEGRFPSLYKNRFVPEGVPEQAIVQDSQPTKIFVCADGDVAANELDRRSGQPLPLGFDPFTRQTFSNKEWLLNTLAYLVDENGLISTRLKEVKLRPLDKVRVQQEATTWRVLNLVGPLLLLLAFGAFKFWWRKRQFAR